MRAVFGAVVRLANCHVDGRVGMGERPHIREPKATIRCSCCLHEGVNTVSLDVERILGMYTFRAIGLIVTAGFAASFSALLALLTSEAAEDRCLADLT